MKKYNITILSFIFFSHISLAETGGIYLDTTRVIFDSNDLSTKVKFNNNTDKNWLLRAWVSDYNSKNKNDNFGRNFLVCGETCRELLLLASPKREIHTHV